MKFVQIAAAGSGTQTVTLYALDENGHIWVLRRNETWRRLPPAPERETKPQPWVPE